jgi:hypothetical protein
LKDDKATAMQLFALISIIVQSTISAKTQIEAMYASLPPPHLRREGPEADLLGRRPAPILCKSVIPRDRPLPSFGHR